MSSGNFNLSNIEKKIRKNTFQPNSNNLKMKEDASSVSKFFTSFSKASEDMPSDFFQGLDLSGLSALDENLSHTIQEQIQQAPPGTEIILPDCTVSLDSLYINSPVLLRGMPGTSLEITSGSIVVDFSSHSKESLVGDTCEKAVICEISITYNLEDSQKESGALFVMDSPNTNLEVRDCDIRSLCCKDQQESQEAEFQFEDVCFWVNGVGYKRHFTRAASRYNSQLTIKSCNISGFFEVVRGGINSSVHLEKSHLNMSKWNAISLINPKDLTVRENVIENCKNSAIEVRVIPDGATLPSSGSVTNSTEAFTRQIQININEIRLCGSNGINIWSEHVTAFPISVYVSKNKIFKSKRQGFSLKHLHVLELTLTSNDCICNHGSGIWLQKVYSLTQTPLTVSYNRSLDSLAGYGVYLYDAGCCLDTNEVVRNKLGGIMAVGSSNKDTPKADLKITRCVISENGDNGITVLDYMHASVTINHTRVSDSKKHGVYLMLSRETEVTPAQKEQVVPISSFKGTVSLAKCSVERNKGSGVMVSKMRCFIEDCELSDNLSGAVEMGEATQHLVNIRQDTLQSVDQGRKLVEKKQLCRIGSNNKCFIF